MQCMPVHCCRRPMAAVQAALAPLRRCPLAAPTLTAWKPAYSAHVALARAAVAVLATVGPLYIPHTSIGQYCMHAWPVQPLSSPLLLCSPYWLETERQLAKQSQSRQRGCLLTQPRSWCRPAQEGRCRAQRDPAPRQYGRVSNNTQTAHRHLQRIRLRPHRHRICRFCCRRWLVLAVCPAKGGPRVITASCRLCGGCTATSTLESIPSISRCPCTGVLHAMMSLSTHMPRWCF
jgi:hypothetical protein